MHGRDARSIALGLKPLEPLLAEIDAIKDVAGVQRMIGAASTSIGDRRAVRACARRRTTTIRSQVIADLAAAGLGLPDRDYYLKPEPRFAEARAKYLAHVSAACSRSRATRGRARGRRARVFGMEDLRRGSASTTWRCAIPTAIDHRMTFDELQQLDARASTGRAYFDAARRSQADLNVQEPKFLARARPPARRDPARRPGRPTSSGTCWTRSAPSLSTPFVEESVRASTAASWAARRDEAALEALRRSRPTRLLGEALGRKYVEKYFPPAAKARMQDAGRGTCCCAMNDTIARARLDGPARPRQKALEKLVDLQPQDRLSRQVEGLLAASPIRRDAFVGTTWSAALAFERRTTTARTIGKPVDRGRWGMTPPTVERVLQPAR